LRRRLFHESTLGSRAQDEQQPAQAEPRGSFVLAPSQFNRVVGSPSTIGSPPFTVASTPISSGDSGRPRSDTFDLSGFESSLPRVAQPARLNYRTRDSNGSSSTASAGSAIPARTGGHRARFGDDNPRYRREESLSDGHYEVPRSHRRDLAANDIRNRVPTPYPRSRPPMGYMTGSRSASDMREDIGEDPDVSTINPTPTPSPRRGDQPRETGARRKTPQ